MKRWLIEYVIPTVTIAVVLVVMIIPFTLTLSNYASDPVAPENFLHHYDTPIPSSTASPIQPPACVEPSRVPVASVTLLRSGSTRRTGSGLVVPSCQGKRHGCCHPSRLPPLFLKKQSKVYKLSREKRYFPAKRNHG